MRVWALWWKWGIAGSSRRVPIAARQCHYSPSPNFRWLPAYCESRDLVRPRLRKHRALRASVQVPRTVRAVAGKG
jgi:hypothetical protein